MKDDPCERIREAMKIIEKALQAEGTMTFLEAMTKLFDNGGTDYSYYNEVNNNETPDNSARWHR